jgi:hypothetical protein
MTLRVHAQVNPAASLAPEFTAARVAAALEGFGEAVRLSHGSTPEALEAALPEAEVLVLTGQAPLGGAVLDALPQEPLPPDSPLWDTPNLIVTAHCGLYDPSAYASRCLDPFRANLRRYLAGEPLQQVVERGRGY